MICTCIQKYGKAWFAQCHGSIQQFEAFNSNCFHLEKWPYFQLPTGALYFKALYALDRVSYILFRTYDIMKVECG